MKGFPHGHAPHIRHLVGTLFMKPLLTGLLSRQPTLQTSGQTQPAAQPVDLWFHATEPEHIPAFLQLRRSIAIERPGLTGLITTDGSISRPDGLEPALGWSTIERNAHSIAAFFADWAPRLCLWAGGAIIPPLVSETAKRGVPMFLIDANAESFQTNVWRGEGLSQRRALKLFSTFLARDSEAEVTLCKMGIEPDDIFVAGRMQQGVPSLPHNETDLDELSDAISSRPTWLAARTRAEELDIILPAHLKASRAAHRLLLILVPDDGDEYDAFKQALDRHKLRYSVWPDMSGLADETAQVLLAEDPFEMGLWLRVSPVTFMGASLVSGFGGHNPYAAANLGSAILYGPNVGKHLLAYSRFASAGGARIVRDVDTLTAAVSQLSAPDRAAQMAMAAWEIATEGADVTDRVTSLVHDALDHLEES